MMENETLDFSLGDSGNIAVLNPIPPLPEAPEEEIKPKVVVVGIHKSSKRKKPEKYSEEEQKKLFEAIDEKVALITAEAEALASMARSMYTRGVRTTPQSDENFYRRREALINVVEVVGKMSDDALCLGGGANVSRLLEHIALEWCGEHRIVYIPMSSRQRKEAHRLTNLQHKYGNRNPLDYLGGYFYQVLYGWKRDSKTFSWAQFLNEERLNWWIEGDLDRRMKKATVGHQRYDSDLDVEAFFNRHLTIEERLKNETLSSISRAFDNQPDDF